MAYSERFPKQKVVRRDKIGTALKSNRERNLTNKVYILPPKPKKK